MSLPRENDIVTHRQMTFTVCVPDDGTNSLAVLIAEIAKGNTIKYQKFAADERTGTYQVILTMDGKHFKRGEIDGSPVFCVPELLEENRRKEEEAAERSVACD